MGEVASSPVCPTSVDEAVVDADDSDDDEGAPRPPRADAWEFGDDDDDDDETVADAARAADARFVRPGWHNEGLVDSDDAAPNSPG